MNFSRLAIYFLPCACGAFAACTQPALYTETMSTRAHPPVATISTSHNPTTVIGWRNEEAFGGNACASGQGLAVDSAGNLQTLETGEPLSVISIDPNNGYLTVIRKNYNTVAILTPAAIGVRRYQ